MAGGPNGAPNGSSIVGPDGRGPEPGGEQGGDLLRAYAAEQAIQLDGSMAGSAGRLLAAASVAARRAQPPMR